MTLDEDFLDGLKDDMEIFDGTCTLTVHHNLGDTSVNFADGTAQRSVVDTEVENCLFRQPSDRNGPSVPQLHERNIAIQKDSFNSVDTVIEVPIIEGLAISINDTIEDKVNDREWKVVAIDTSTLRTRYRLGCTVFE